VDDLQLRLLVADSYPHLTWLLGAEKAPLGTATAGARAAPGHDVEHGAVCWPQRCSVWLMSPARAQQISTSVRVSSLS